MQIKRKWLSAACAAAFVGVAGSAAVAMASGAVGHGPEQERSLQPETAAISAAGSLPSVSGSLPDMVERVSPAVVQIQVRSGGQYAAGEGPGDTDSPYEQDSDETAGGAGGVRMALGSGFVIDPRGVIVTNNHVVEGAEEVRVKFSDGRTFAADVLGTDKKTDLAVLRVRGGGRFQTINWGDSDRLRVGEGVFAVGSPFGLGNTVTSGILSARGRQIGEGPYDNFLQVDAAINSGNSGGPLFDTFGRVVGVNTAIYSPSGGNVGIGFAIPSHTVRLIAAQIMSNGTVSRGRIGVELAPSAADEPTADGARPAKGAVIAAVEPGGPADQAGLQAGDVVTAFNGREIVDARGLAQAVAEARIGSSAQVTIGRDGRPGTIQLRVAPGQQG